MVKDVLLKGLGIRNISLKQEEKKVIRGYKKLNRRITYHHITPKIQGGKMSLENGANIARYNHDWLEKLSQAKRDIVNKGICEFKFRIAEMQLSGEEIDFKTAKEIGFEIGEYVTIKLEGADILREKVERENRLYNRQKEKDKLRRLLESEEEHII